MRISDWSSDVCSSDLMVNCPAASVYKIPDAMPYEIAAGFPITYGTTWHALVDRGRMKQGEVLLVHGAAGGVGLNAVELGRELGATVIGTVGSDERSEEHTSELQSLMRISYAVFCFK